MWACNTVPTFLFFEADRRACISLGEYHEYAYRRTESSLVSYGWRDVSGIAVYKNMWL